MLEDILKLYVMAMAGDVRSPIPHLFGPAGCGKSSSVEMAANILNVNLHIINVYFIEINLTKLGIFSSK